MCLAVLQGVQHRGDKVACIQRPGLARFQIHLHAVLFLRHGDTLFQRGKVVIRAGDVVPAAKVEPLHPGQQVTEFRFQRGQGGRQRVGILLAQGVEVQAVQQVGQVRVLRRSGMELEVTLPAADVPLRAAVMTLSDKGAAGERVDTSGPRAAQLLAEAGYEIVEQVLLPDAQKKIERELIRLADSRQVDLIITTGGTGLSLRDVTPEATMAVATRNVPGIAEAIRAESLKITRRAMLSRGVSVVRGQTLIVNLPGSTKAVEEALAIVLPQLEHGLRILKGSAHDCARK